MSYRVLASLRGMCVTKLVEPVMSNRLTSEGNCERRMKGFGWIEDLVDLSNGAPNAVPCREIQGILATPETF